MFAQARRRHYSSALSAGSKVCSKLSAVYDWVRSSRHSGWCFSLPNAPTSLAYWEAAYGRMSNVLTSTSDKPAVLWAKLPSLLVTVQGEVTSGRFMSRSGARNADGYSERAAAPLIQWIHSEMTKPVLDRGQRVSHIQYLPSHSKSNLRSALKLIVVVRNMKRFSLTQEHLMHRLLQLFSQHLSCPPSRHC